MSKLVWEALWWASETKLSHKSTCLFCNIKHFFFVSCVNVVGIQVQTEVMCLL